MQQQEETKNVKQGAIKRLLKRIAIGLFILLIIALCILRAPWKVLALFIIILASFTVLPKPARKWFWLGAAGVVIALIIWVSLPDDNEGWRPYTFNKELAALEAKHAIPDSENAALIYNELLETYDSNTIWPDFLDDEAEELTWSHYWSGSDYPELSQWLKKQKPTLEGLQRASKKAECRFPIVADPFSLEESFDRTYAIRPWAYLLIRAANNDIGEGRIEEGLEKYACMLRMAEHIYQQTTMVDLLVGISIESLAINQFNRFAVTGEAMGQHLSFIEQALIKNKPDWERKILEIMECDKLLLKNMWGLCYEVNKEGKVRLNRNPLSALRAQFPDDDFLEQIPLLGYWQKKLIKGWAILHWFYLPSTPQKLSKYIDSIYAKMYEKITRPDSDLIKPPVKRRGIRLNFLATIKLLRSLAEPTYYKVHEMYQRAIAQKKAARLIVALRRYENQNGYWPENLDDVRSFVQADTLIDPLNGGSFVYKLTDENFILYSKGKNGIDEGGRRDEWDEEEAGADDILIWPSRLSETSKEDPNDK